LDDLQRPSGERKLRFIERAEQRAQPLPDPSSRRDSINRKLGNAARREPQDIVFAGASYPKYWGDCNGEAWLRPAQRRREARRRGKRTRARARAGQREAEWPGRRPPATGKACSPWGAPQRCPWRGSGPAQPPDQAGGIPAAAADLRYLVIETGDHLGDGELSGDLPC